MNYNNAPAISITVPVYNTSKYLRKCLDSLAAQTLYDIEFILVDDGSTDDCGAICNEYAAKDHRFKVIHQPNGGLASARQSGLDVARGEYIIVCDSDDWVEPDMYEKLYKKAQETDAEIVCCGYFAEYQDGRSIPKQYWFKENKEIVDKNDFIRHGAGSSWIKLIKKSLYDIAKADYTSGINLGEDALIVYKLMKANPKIVQIQGNLYHYRRLFGESSYTNNVKMTHIYQLRYTYDWLKGNYSDDEFEDIKFQRAIDLAFACLRVSNPDIEFINNFIDDELNWKRIHLNKKSLKSIMIVLMKLLPLETSKFIIKKIYPFIYK